MFHLTLNDMLISANSRSEIRWNFCGADDKFVLSRYSNECNELKLSAAFSRNLQHANVKNAVNFPSINITVFK